MVNGICGLFEQWHHVSNVVGSTRELEPPMTLYILRDRMGNVETTFLEDALQLRTCDFCRHRQFEAINEVLDGPQPLERLRLQGLHGGG